MTWRIIREPRWHGCRIIASRQGRCRWESAKDAGEGGCLEAWFWFMSSVWSCGWGYRGETAVSGQILSNVAGAVD